MLVEQEKETYIETKQKQKKKRKIGGIYASAAITMTCTVLVKLLYSEGLGYIIEDCWDMIIYGVIGNV